MPISYDDACALLDEHGQSQALRFWDRLDKQQRTGLLTQIESLNFDNIAYMRQALSEEAATGDETRMEPAPVVPRAQVSDSDNVAAGEKALRAGEVGVLLVAGGQGSRLGYHGPKGCYSLGPISGASLFEIHARKILALEQVFETRVPFYVMTSKANDEATRKFFEDNSFFGLNPGRVIFFTQGMWPALTAEGKIILDMPDHIFMNPDGHGGTLTALADTGMLADVKERGLQTLFYFQVDNPLVEIADPGFLGLHRRAQADMSVKVCAKRDPQEGLGVVVRRDGHFAVVEYTELTEEEKNERLADGTLRYRFGSVAIHVFSVPFLELVAGLRLPLHVAHKKVPFCDDEGKTVKPDKPSAYKFEKFIFDVVPHASTVINVEFAREEEFSPVKNASGNDSPDSARRDMMLKFARWLDACGVEVPRNADGMPEHRIEIDPCYARNAEALRARIEPGMKIAGDTLLV